MMTIQQARTFARALEAHAGAMRYASAIRYTEDTALPLIEAVRALVDAGEMQAPDGWPMLLTVERALEAVAGIDDAGDHVKEARVRVCLHIASQIIESSLTDAEREDIAKARLEAAERAAKWDREWAAKQEAAQ